MYHHVFDRIDAVVGEHVWNFADFATRPAIVRVDGIKNASSPATAGQRPRRSGCAGGGTRPGRGAGWLSRGTPVAGDLGRRSARPGVSRTAGADPAVPRGPW
ncbi:hypothetical protein ACU686_27915 [Yinghuangia aomiensis]